MTNKEDLLNNKDFLKSFKNGEDLTSFFKAAWKERKLQLLDERSHGFKSSWRRRYFDYCY